MSYSKCTQQRNNDNFTDIEKNWKIELVVFPFVLSAAHNTTLHSKDTFNLDLALNFTENKQNTQCTVNIYFSFCEHNIQLFRNTIPRRKKNFLITYIKSFWVRPRMVTRQNQTVEGLLTWFLQRI